MRKEVDPNDSSRGFAFELWKTAGMPKVTIFKTFNISRLIKIAKRSGMKTNMLMCWCIGHAASGIEEFYTLPVGGHLWQYDRLAVNIVVKTANGAAHLCDIPYSEDIHQFNEAYLRLTRQVHDTNEDHLLGDEYMAVNTSTLAECEIDGVASVYSELFTNPFLAWGKYRRGLFKTTLPISFQFHHAQMDGFEAGRFLNGLQEVINSEVRKKSRMAGKWCGLEKKMYFRGLKIRKNSMTDSRKNIMMVLGDSPRTAFNTRSVALLLDERRDVSLTKRLNYYVKKGFLLNPRKGIYAKKNFNPEELAGMVFVPSYISLEYVLQKAGVIFQYDSAITSVSYLNREIEMCGLSYRYSQVKGEILCNLEGIERHDNIYIATPERALLDMMYLHSECYFDNLHSVSKRQVLRLLPVYQSARLTERVNEMFKQ